ncbi:DUF3182 family protein [Lysobacter sp. MMG2]|uniref:DUF3182 family protein n=1 Tax=Lysobacter sp. MMG2 TaxID=2801338 RepID=UPI001C237BE2|nr:DUF3182 family protein [Lysobacter sp. MMG2]MBU8977634.1 DUF3182 family protein [Lysobacter sp. MMG2]
MAAGGAWASTASDTGRATCAQGAGCVVELLRRARRTEHEAATGRWIGERLAGLLGYEYGGVHAPDTDADAAPPERYFLPDSTLSTADARALHIHGPEQLLGGVVPHPFVATKSITHRLVDGARVVPVGWSHALGAALDEVTLPGFAAFSVDDVARAAKQLFEQGLPARIKRADGIGGVGQSVATDRKTLDAALAHLDVDCLERLGAVVELNLKPVKTYSVGTVAVGEQRIAYFGMQRLTRNRHGVAVYGGSSLACLRGGLEDVMATLQDEAERRVLRCAIRYDAEVSRAYPEFFASRRNYDVALGVDPSGVPRTGVLEQSWRIGGATPAEILALEAMHRDPRLSQVHVSTHETYELIDAPLGAQVYFHGEDPAVGPMTKYAVLDAQDDAHGR